LKYKKYKLILKNIEKFIDFPEILKTKNEELISINQKLTSLKNKNLNMILIRINMNS